MTIITIEFYSADFRGIQFEKLNKILDECTRQKIDVKITIDYRLDGLMK